MEQWNLEQEEVMKGNIVLRTVEQWDRLYEYAAMRDASMHRSNFNKLKQAKQELIKARKHVSERIASPYQLYLKSFLNFF
jgi:hypothetical protein